MRSLAVICLLSLAGCVGTPDQPRVEGFGAPDALHFVYSAQTNTVMSENDDGVAERLRRDWLAEALRAHGMCYDGYVVDTRRLVVDPDGPFANGGNIVYSGRCL